MKGLRLQLQRVKTARSLSLTDKGFDPRLIHVVSSTGDAIQRIVTHRMFQNLVTDTFTLRKGEK
jgi:hypothetical protein